MSQLCTIVSTCTNDLVRICHLKVISFDPNCVCTCKLPFVLACLSVCHAIWHMILNMTCFHVTVIYSYKNNLSPHLYMHFIISSFLFPLSHTCTNPPSLLLLHSSIPSFPLGATARYGIYSPGLWLATR